MAIRQTNSSELRYLKRQNLENEARILGNMYRDQIHQQGIDCIYHKLDTKKFIEFKDVIDKNTLLRYAYGYDHDPDYSLSASMLTFMEVENDIFQLNKYGLNPNMDVTFVFDSKDFACAMATQLGQYKEYNIDETEIICEVPNCEPTTSADVFPYRLGLGYKEEFHCKNLTGRLSVELNGYEVDKEYTIQCHPYEHNDLTIEFPVNDDIYKSFTHKIKSDGYLDSMIYLTFKVKEVQKSKTDIRHVLTGKIHGTILFYDMTSIGKYYELIHPEVGDLVTIDFPDEKNREQYEITEAIDKQMTPDGINPFMHKYIWKCKARRYFNQQEDMEENEGNERMEEMRDFERITREEITNKISIYDEGEDRVYGGYEQGTNDVIYDKQIPNPLKRYEFEYLDSDTAIDILEFYCGSKLVTNGYDLIFVNKAGNAYKVVTDEFHADAKSLGAAFEKGLQYLKATDELVVFVNITGECFRVVQDETANADETIMCLNSLYDKTLDTGPELNKKGDNFYKFKGSKTVLIATETSLFCRLASGKMYKLV